jgi:hypothetical protein
MITKDKIEDLDLYCSVRKVMFKEIYRNVMKEGKLLSEKKEDEIDDQIMQEYLKRLAEKKKQNEK